MCRPHMIHLSRESIARRPSRPDKPHLVPFLKRPRPAGKSVSVMAEELRDKMASLRIHRPRLNASTAEAGKVVQEVEALLESLGVGIPAEVRIGTRIGRDDDGRAIETERAFAYDRLGGKYRLMVIERFFIDGDGDGEYETSIGDDDGTAWGSLPRARKLESFAKLPELLDKIVDEARRLAELADKTVAEVRGVIGEVSPAPPPSRKRRVGIRTPTPREEFLEIVDLNESGENEGQPFSERQRAVLESAIGYDDILPAGYCPTLGLREGATYGAAARVLLNILAPGVTWPTNAHGDC